MTKNSQGVTKYFKSEELDPTIYLGTLYSLHYLLLQKNQGEIPYVKIRIKVLIGKHISENAYFQIFKLRVFAYDNNRHLLMQLNLVNLL